MTARPAIRTRSVEVLMMLVLVGGSLGTGGCALTHRSAPAIQELALQYEPPDLAEVQPVDAAIKIRRFAALSPFDGTSMYSRSGSYQVNSFNYDRWVTNPGNQVTDLLYRDFAAAHAFREVFPYLSAEQARFQLEGTVVEFAMLGSGGSWRARLDLSVTVIDGQARESSRRVLLQREFDADQALEGGSAEQYAAGMSAAMKRASEEIIRAAHGAVARRLAEAPATPGGPSG